MNDMRSPSDKMLLEFNRLRRDALRLDEIGIFPWRRPCLVKVLLLTDGGLDFGMGDFGLGAFVRILKNDKPFYANFQITLAHLRADTGPDVMQGAPEIQNSIRGFRFDEPAHFAPDLYDEIWLFGIETNFHNAAYGTRNSAAYPSNRLSDAELAAIAGHMRSGRGIFATGDHGALGQGLCGSVMRVRNMRHWDSFLGSTGEDEVSMRGPRRNDTNRVGHDAGTQFSDQSDDVPQKLDLKLYSSRIGFLRNARYPHPVLCGTFGRIDVFPDHPHEGECNVPADLSLTYAVSGEKEYPDALDGSGQVAPEVIATSHVPAGNTARASFVATGTKISTAAHSFGAVSAYDGHRAGVGRVLCDATWHHFINVNLIGVVEGAGFDQFGDTDHAEDASKHDGFLSSAAGRAAFARIKNYYTNIAVWIAPPQKISCFGSRFWWEIIYADRIMEAALSDPNTQIEKIPLDVLWSIGVHARDVIGHRASQCQTTEWIVSWIEKLWPEVRPWIDPWGPFAKYQKLEDIPLPIVDPMPVVDIALGAAIVSLRQTFPYPAKEMDAKFDDIAIAVAEKGARLALDRAIRHTEGLMKDFKSTLRAATK